MTIKIMDDSGAVIDSFDIEPAELRTLDGQLPEGWCLEVVGR